jgi:hypothetical protein
MYTLVLNALKARWPKYHIDNCQFYYFNYDFKVIRKESLNPIKLPLPEFSVPVEVIDNTQGDVPEYVRKYGAKESRSYTISESKTKSSTHSLNIGITFSFAQIGYEGSWGKSSTISNESIYSHEENVERAFKVIPKKGEVTTVYETKTKDIEITEYEVELLCAGHVYYHIYGEAFARRIGLGQLLAENGEIEGLTSADPDHCVFKVITQLKREFIVPGFGPSPNPIAKPSPTWTAFKASDLAFQEFPPCELPKINIEEAVTEEDIAAKLEQRPTLK